VAGTGWSPCRRAAEAVEQAAIGATFEAIGGERGPGSVAAQALEPTPVARGDGNGGVK